MKAENYKNLLEEFNKDIKFDHELKKKTWFNIGGKSKIFYKANNLKDLVKFLKIIDNKEKIFILGAGSNTLIPDHFFDGIVIKLGKNFNNISLHSENIIIAGGGEAEHWGMTSLFDAMGALSTKYNDSPEKASRAYDRDRDGFVIAGGGGAVILEEKEHAIKRGAKIYAQLTGYAATSDGEDMVSPSGEGGERCMRIALGMTGKEKVDYINAHGTSTPAGDITELKAIENVFGKDLPLISSTKSLSGHSLGAAGVHESIFCLIMMKEGFAAGSANIENLDEGAINFPIIQKNQETELKKILSNSFGFGGTNATLIFEKI